MHCSDHVELNSTSSPIYLDMNVSSMEEFCCISFLNAPTRNEIPMKYHVPNMLPKIC